MRKIDEINFRVPGNQTEHSLGNKYIKDELKYEAIKLLCELNEELEPLPRLKVLGCKPHDNTYTLDILPFPIKEENLKLVKMALMNFVKSYFNVKFCSICDVAKNGKYLNITHDDEEHESFFDKLGDE